MITNDDYRKFLEGFMKLLASDHMQNMTQFFPVIDVLYIGAEKELRRLSDGGEDFLVEYDQIVKALNDGRLDDEES